MNREIVGRKQEFVDQLIKEAEERKGRGDPIAVDELNQLRRERGELKHEMRQASDKDYILDRNRKRAIRTKFEKLIDTLHCEK